MDRNSPWGIVVHSATEWDVSELHKGGVAFLRIDFLWDVVQPRAGGPFTWLHYDRLVRWAADRGMWILAGLAGTPQWAVDPARMAADGNRYRPSAYPPKDLALWNNYVTQVVTRYGARVRYWGIWNEPDSFNEPVNVCFWRGTRQEFMDANGSVLANAVNIIRGFGSDHRICVPDLARVSAFDAGTWAWINELLKSFGRRINAVTVHSYRGSGDGSDVIEKVAIAGKFVRDYNSSNGTQIELWITETGWMNTEHSEATISAKIQDLCREVRNAPWVRKVFPYVWSDNYSDAFSFKIHSRGLRQQWTGYRTAINAPQPAVPFERDSLVVSHNVPPQMSPGRSYTVQMTFRNTGRWTWPKQAATRLGFGSRPTAPGQPYSIKVDISDARLRQVVELVSGVTAPMRVPVVDRAPVPPQGETTFAFTVTAPAQPGCYLIGWCMVDENPADPMWFGQGLLQRLFVQ